MCLNDHQHILQVFGVGYKNAPNEILVPCPVSEKMTLEIRTGGSIKRYCNFWFCLSNLARFFHTNKTDVYEICYKNIHIQNFGIWFHFPKNDD